MEKLIKTIINKPYQLRTIEIVQTTMYLEDFIHIIEHQTNNLRILKLDGVKFLPDPSLLKHQ